MFNAQTYPAEAINTTGKYAAEHRLEIRAKRGASIKMIKIEAVASLPSHPMSRPRVVAIK
jgi:hypothetical protein